MQQRQSLIHNGVRATQNSNAGFHTMQSSPAPSFVTFQTVPCKLHVCCQFKVLHKVLEPVATAKSRGTKHDCVVPNTKHPKKRRQKNNSGHSRRAPSRSDASPRRLQLRNQLLHFWQCSNWLAFSAAAALSVDRDGDFSGGASYSSRRWARWKDRWRARRLAIDFALYPKRTQFTGS